MSMQLRRIQILFFLQTLGTFYNLFLLNEINNEFNPNIQYTKPMSC